MAKRETSVSLAAMLSAARQGACVISPTLGLVDLEKLAAS